MPFEPPALSPQESFISMRELDPSPVDDSPVELSQSDYFPPGSTESKSTPTRSTTSLGLRDHSAIWWLTKIQRYSSYTFSTFLAAHITNISIIPLITQSIGASENYLLLTRPYYQSPVFEPLVIFAPLALHITSGIALRLARRRQAVDWYGAESRAERRNLAWPKLSGTSLLGYLLVPAVAGHAYLNRALPVLVEGGSSGIGLSYISHCFARFPIISYAAYTALLGIGVSHFVWGWSRWLGWHSDTATGVNGYERQQAQKQRWYSINGVALATLILWAAGGLGIIARGGAAFGWKGKSYDKLLLHVPLIGHWLVS